MIYQVALTASAKKDLAGLDATTRQRITKKLLSLTLDPRGTDTIKIIAEDSYRTRVGDYRIVYTIDDTARIVAVTRIRHRSEVYR